jgi:sugar phosphate isomerase/epimerase
VSRLPADIGVSSAAWGEWFLPQALDRAAGFADLVEIYSGGRHTLTSAANRASVRAAGLSVTVHAPYGGLAIGGPGKRARREAIEAHREHLAAAADVGALRYVVHPDVAPRRYRRGRDDRVLAALDESFHELAELQRQTGVPVVVENMPALDHSHLTLRSHLSCSLPTPGDVDLGELGFCLDVGHASLCGALDDFLAHPPDRLKHVHLHDNRGPEDSGDPHRALGDGVVDVGAVLKCARDHGALTILEMQDEPRLADSIAYLEREGMLVGG